MGALEVKKLHLLSEWALEGCTQSPAQSDFADPKLEDTLPPNEEARIRAQARKTELLGKTTWQIGNVTGQLREELLVFLISSGGCWEEGQVAAHLEPLLKTSGGLLIEG